MYCKYCGKRLPDDARFCIYCGHGVSESVEEGQNVRGGDEPRNYAAFEETQGAGNYYRPYPIAVEDMAVPEKKRKKNLLPIVILVAVIVLLGAAVVFAFHIKNRETGEQENKNGKTQSESSNTDESRIENKDAKGSGDANDVKGSQASAPGKLTAIVTSAVPDELAGISNGGSLRYNEAGNPDWFETRYFWKQSDGDCVCRVSGNSGKDLTFEFSDGVVLSEKYCAYEIQADGTVLYSYKKGWTVKYDPASDTLFPVCDFNPVQAECEGAYFPISQDEFERNLPGGTMGANDGDYSKENWMRSQTATRMIIKHLDNYGSLSFISDSGKSAITFDEDKEGSDSTDMFYTNISGVTPDDMWGIMDGGVAGNIATLQVRNAQGQRAKVVADFESGTVDFAGVIYRNTAMRYYP